MVELEMESTSVVGWKQTRKGHLGKHSHRRQLHMGNDECCLLGRYVV
jgi:hypothetical protein